MLIFDSAADIAAAPQCTTDARLSRLLADRAHDWAATGLLGLTLVVIVETGDTEESIVEAAGFSPLVNPIDGVRWGSPGFHCHHDWLERHDGWSELIFTIGNDGWACVMFVQDSAETLTDLLSLCRACAGG